MLLFWRGWGFMVPVILICWVFAAVAFAIATAPANGDPDADAHVNLLFAVVFAVSAVSVFLMDRRRRRPISFVDANTGEPAVLVHSDDHFMFVPVRYYVWVFVAVAVWMAVKSFT